MRPGRKTSLCRDGYVPFSLASGAASFKADSAIYSQGAWAGKGAKKSKNARKFVKKIDGVDAAQRKDAKLNHVIISERKDKKAAKYMLKDLPFPYTSAAQHEHKLRTPMGPEWSTSTVSPAPLHGNRETALPASNLERTPQFAFADRVPVHISCRSCETKPFPPCSSSLE